MPQQRLTTEAIIHKLREAEVLLSQGRTVLLVCRQTILDRLGEKVKETFRQYTLSETPSESCTAAARGASGV